MDYPKQTQESMAARVMRFEELKAKGHPDHVHRQHAARHMRMNYAVIGDTASENPDFSIRRAITEPHRYQIGMVWAPPGCGPAWHTHDYVESFFMLTGPWTFYWGNEDDPEKVEGEFVLNAWDMISLPPGMYRSFEYTGDEIGWIYAVLESHEVFEGKDPYWSPQIEAEAAPMVMKPTKAARWCTRPIMRRRRRAERILAEDISRADRGRTERLSSAANRRDRKGRFHNENQHGTHSHDACRQHAAAAICGRSAVRAGSGRSL